MNSVDVIHSNLSSDAYCIIPGFLPPDLITALSADIDGLAGRGELTRAGVGQGHKRSFINDIRRDNVFWFADDETEPVRQELLRRVGDFREALNRQFFLNVTEFEGHYAVFGPGAFYRRHLDVFRNDDARVVSFVIYLNSPDWTRGEGGLLRLFPEGAQPVEIAPTGGTLACFLSREIEHEVTEANRERRSFTGWFKQRRAPAL